MDVELVDTEDRLWDLSICRFWFPQWVLESIPFGHLGTTVYQNKSRIYLFSILCHLIRQKRLKYKNIIFGVCLAHIQIVGWLFFFCFFCFCFFLLYPQHVEIPRPGIELEPLQWQCWILNLLSHQGTPTSSFHEACSCWATSSYTVQHYLSSYILFHYSITWKLHYLRVEEKDH